MVTVAQRAANGRNTHTHVDRTHSLTHLQHSYNHVGQLSYYRIWNQIYILKVLEGGGTNRSTRRKPRQPAR